MSLTLRSRLLRYGLAILAVWLVVAAKSLLLPFTGDESPFLLFVLTVIVSGWYGGFGPALVATGLSAVLSDYFFLSPGAVFVHNTLGEGFRLGLFVVEGAIIGWAIASFRQTREILQEMNQRKDDFITILAHELRNCLSPLRLASQMLEQRAGSTASDLHQIRSFLERQVAHMSRLIDDLLESSRATRGKIELQKEVVELGDACAQAAQSSQALLDERDQTLTLSVPPEPLRLVADPLRLTQILTNLLANASKYSGKGGRIWLTAERQKEHVLIHVRDDGVGISPEVLPHIFEPFTQSRGASERSRGGVGVGLAVVRSLVELHGGSITVDSAGHGHGTEFVVRLPCLALEQTHRPHHPALSSRDR